jgi:hypothetical protein
MRVIGISEFRDKASEMFRSPEPILVTRRGEVTGLYLPYPTQTLPMELKRELFAQISETIGRRLQEAGITEEEILDDFERFRITPERSHRDYGSTICK